ncbi:hypothetical protein Klosneuvirus_1_216 [Klosneuvirus KNV1]|uniref:Chromosomal protein MC1 domain-containing protein n=1 Tax=Klosneuvirus KNV1 TaxID=1977640 RepID=A0A1V0SI07_9VIRU|nr:hypothetical protein Klosneuvirus_1_216 [Klosneuvirus KNV1]
MSSKQTKKATKETKSVEVPKKTEPVVEAPKKGGAKKVVEKKVVAPKKVEPVVKEVTPQKATKTAVEKVTKTVVEKTADKPKKQVKKAGKKLAKKVANKEVVPKTEGKGSRTRYFKVFVDGEEAPHGRFSGAKPKQAANKALTSLAKALEQNGGAGGKINFSIVECTRGSKHKKYEYTGERVKLDTPMRVKIGSGPDAKEIVYNYSNRVMKAKTA